MASAGIEQLLATLDLDVDVVSYLVDCLAALGAAPPTEEVAEVLAPFADELEMSDDDAAALAEDIVATLAAPPPAAAPDAPTAAPAPAPAPAPEPTPSAADKPVAVDPLAAGGDLPYGGDWNAAMAAQDRAAVRLILEHRDRVATEVTATRAREERAAKLAEQQQQQQAAEQQQPPPDEVEERRVDPADGNVYTRQEFIDAYGGTIEWDAIGAQLHGYRKPELVDEFPAMGKSKKKNAKNRRATQQPPEPEPEPKSGGGSGLSSNAPAFSMSAAAAAPVFQFGGPAPAPENAWGPALGQQPQPQQPQQQWGGTAIPGPPPGQPGQPPNRHQWEAQPQQQQQQWPPQQQQQQQQQGGVAPAQLDFATKMKLRNLQEAYGWIDKEQVAHAYITTGAHMGKTEQWLKQNFPKVSHACACCLFFLSICISFVLTVHPSILGSALSLRLIAVDHSPLTSRQGGSTKQQQQQLVQRCQGWA
jgi:hypothetical protein